MYPSDYVYATSGGTTTNRASCLVKEIRSWYDSSVSDCKNNDWMYSSSIWQWTISPTAYSHGVFIVERSSSVSGNDAFNDSATRPVVHLNSAIKVITGSGTKESPYILG